MTAWPSEREREREREGWREGGRERNRVREREADPGRASYVKFQLAEPNSNLLNPG